MSTPSTNNERLAVVETKLDSLEEDVKEIKSEVKSTRENMVEIKTMLSEMKSKQDSNNLSKFLKDNYKVILIILSFLGVGQYSLQEISASTHAPQKAKTEQVQQSSANE